MSEIDYAARAAELAHTAETAPWGGEYTEEDRVRMLAQAQVYAVLAQVQATGRLAAATERVGDMVTWNTYAVESLTRTVRASGAGAGREVRDAVRAVTEQMHMSSRDVGYELEKLREPVTTLADHAEALSVMPQLVGQVEDLADIAEEALSPRRSVVVRAWWWLFGRRLTPSTTAVSDRLAPGQEIAVEVITAYGESSVSMKGTIEQLWARYPASDGYRLRRVVVARDLYGYWKVVRHCDSPTVAEAERLLAAAVERANPATDKVTSVLSAAADDTALLADLGIAGRKTGDAITTTDAPASTTSLEQL